MRCCASPTTCTGRSSSSEAPPSADRDAAAAFGAMILEFALRPLAKPLGFYGEMVVNECALRIARTLPLHVQEERVNP
jgi:hypothetical protein